MLPFLLIAWMITNGWSYAFVVIGARYGISWMTWLGGVWVSILWIPFTVEKPLTILIAVMLYKLIYKEDFKKIKGRKES